MDTIIIYHNPHCSKSRASLALLEENEVKPKIIYYLETPPEVAELKSLLQKLDMNIRDILRKSENEYEELGLDNDSLSDDILFDFVSKHPKLLQRPIVVRGDKAVIGRPPENVLSLLGD
ncbi:MAG: arsenate reductase (glutaredoxin) [SAR86 cluster bacterium]|uniref:Arsenate reductase n=1 Tax=SAR86 cluster bacterium TaxID=2030880 RepID=A0A2A5B8Y2_9GAMM|nr:MAG: arsenate reductase (glutaredoxin) [SAR86 cluster bacterium]